MAVPPLSPIPAEQAIQAYTQIREAWLRFKEQWLAAEGQSGSEASGGLIIELVLERLQFHLNEFTHHRPQASATHAAIFLPLLRALEHNESRTLRQNFTLQECLESYTPYTRALFIQDIQWRAQRSRQPEEQEALSGLLQSLESGEFDDILKMLEETQRFEPRRAAYSLYLLKPFLITYLEALYLAPEGKLRAIYLGLLRKLHLSVEVYDNLRAYSLTDTRVYQDPPTLAYAHREELHTENLPHLLHDLDQNDIVGYLEDLGNVLAKGFQTSFVQKAFTMLRQAQTNGGDKGNIAIFRALQVLQEQTKPEELYAQQKAPEVLRKSLIKFVLVYFCHEGLYPYMLRRHQYLKDFLVRLYRQPPAFVPREISNLVFITALLANEQLKPPWSLISRLLQPQKYPAEEVLEMLVPFLNELIPPMVDHLIQFVCKLYRLVTPSPQSAKLEQLFSDKVVNSALHPLLEHILRMVQDWQARQNSAAQSPAPLSQAQSTLKNWHTELLGKVFQEWAQEWLTRWLNPPALEEKSISETKNSPLLYKNFSSTAKKRRLSWRNLKLKPEVAYTRGSDGRPRLTDLHEYKSYQASFCKQDALFQAGIAAYLQELGAGGVHIVEIRPKGGPVLWDELVVRRLPLSYNRDYGLAEKTQYFLVIGLLHFSDSKKRPCLKLFRQVLETPQGQRVLMAQELTNKGEILEYKMISVGESVRGLPGKLKAFMDELERSCSLPVWDSAPIQSLVGLIRTLITAEKML